MQMEAGIEKLKDNSLIDVVNIGGNAEAGLTSKINELNAMGISENDIIIAGRLLEEKALDKLLDVSVDEILTKKNKLIAERDEAILKVVDLNKRIEAYNRQLRTKSYEYAGLSLLDGVKTNLEFKELW